MAASAKVTRAAWKPMRCERCQTEYAFEITRDFLRVSLGAPASDDSAVQAAADARAQAFIDAGSISARDDSPCPTCLAFGPDAVTRARQQRYAWMWAPIAPALVFSGLTLAIGAAPHMLGSMLPIIAPSLAVTAALFLARDALMRSHDPNSDALRPHRQTRLANKRTLPRDQYEALKRRRAR